MGRAGAVRTKLQEFRMVVAVVGLAAVAAVTVGIMQANADSSAPPTVNDNGGADGGGADNAGADNAGDGGAPATVNCPSVADKLPEVPAAALAEVESELAALEKQIEDANRRLVTSQGEGGPNFVQNAILGPLEDKRFAVLERIAISIGRHAERPSGLEALAACGLNEVGADNDNGGADDGGADNGGADDGGADDGGADDGGADNGGVDNGGDTGAPATVNCPSVADKLPEVPAAALAEVERELAALEKQIEDANRRLVTSQGEGGPNFVQNAIVGPLEDKRFAVLERIAISIGRHVERPTGLEALAACTLND